MVYRSICQCVYRLGISTSERMSHFRFMLQFVFVCVCVLSFNTLWGHTFIKSPCGDSTAMWGQKAGPHKVSLFYDIKMCLVQVYTYYKFKVSVNVRVKCS